MEITKENINKILKQVLKEERKISSEHSLIEDLGFTSLQLMELVGIIEDEFDIIVPINKAMLIKNVEELYMALEKKEEFLSS